MKTKLCAHRLETVVEKWMITVCKVLLEKFGEGPEEVGEAVKKRQVQVEERGRGIPAEEMGKAVREEQKEETKFDLC